MLLTTLRKYENGEVSETVECSDIDFNTAFQLVEIYLQHSVLMFNNLPRQQENNTFQGGNNKRKFFEALPKPLPVQGSKSGFRFQPFSPYGG